MIDTIIFDFDGVIIDTETPDYETWQEVFEGHGVELKMSIWTQFIGGGFGVFDIYQHLEELSGVKVDRDAVGSEKRKRFLARIEENPLLPGVTDYIDMAKDLGIKLGVASSSGRDWVEGHLTDRGLIQHFEIIRSRDDVAEVKPNPELYLSSVAHLGSTPNKALAIEDSANGVTAAKNAGMYCVAVPNPMTKGLSLDHADMRIDALSDMPLNSLLTRLTQG